MSGKLLLSVLMALLFSLSGQGVERVVKMTTLTDFPPNCFPKPDSQKIAVEVLEPGEDSVQLQGYSWDVVRESYQAMSYTIQLRVAPWSRGMHYLDNGKVDVIFPASKTREREKAYRYSQEIVDKTNIVLYLPADSGFIWNGLESLNGLAFAAVRGWSFGKVWEAADQIIKNPTSTVLQGFDMLDRGRVFGVVGYEDSFDYALKLQGRLQSYRKTSPIDHIEDYLIGLRSESTGILIADFDAGVRRITENGKLAQLQKKWAAVIIINH